MRDNESAFCFHYEDAVTQMEAKKFSEEKKMQYFETSSLTTSGIQEVFKNVADAITRKKGIVPKPEKKVRCTIL